MWSYSGLCTTYNHKGCWLEVLLVSLSLYILCYCIDHEEYIGNWHNNSIQGNIQPPLGSHSWNPCTTCVISHDTKYVVFNLVENTAKLTFKIRHQYTRPWVIFARCTKYFSLKYRPITLYAHVENLKHSLCIRSDPRMQKRRKRTNSNVLLGVHNYIQLWQRCGV